MSFKFVPHGNFTFKQINKVLIANIQGAWNKEAAELYAKKFKAEAQPLISDKWAHLVYLDDWELGVPEIGGIIHELVNWCIANGLTRTAQVYCPSSLKQFHIDQMVTETQGSFQRRAFACEEEAINWLAQQGFTLETNSD